MAHDVFISYSTEDKLIADGVCASLESANIRCWIAPRDILPGTNFETEVERAIVRSRVMVLIFSRHSAASKWVNSEGHIAFESNVIIVPFKIDKTLPQGGWRVILADRHWLDAMDPPTREHIHMLVESVQAIIHGLPPPPPPPPPPPRWIGPVIGVAIVLMVAIGILFASQTLFAPAPSLVPTAIAIAPIAAPSATSAAIAASVPTVIAATKTPVASGSSATSSALPIATMPPTTPATPKPTVPQPTIQPDKILFQENFDDPQYDGSLPPSLTPNRLQEQLPIQRNGALQFLPTVGNDMALNINVQTKPEQFKFLQARIKVASPWSTAASAGGMGIGLFNQTNDKFSLGCSPYIAVFSCYGGVGDSTVPLYNSTPIIVQSDVWYVVRMELANVETLEWRFYLNDTRIGQYTGVPADAASRLKAGSMAFWFQSQPHPNSAPAVYVDDILIVGR